MVYVLLLRGINVGGNNKVSMPQLKKALEELGCENVITYINSGNAVFSDSRGAVKLHAAIEKALKEKFGIAVKALIINRTTFNKIAAALPAKWRNDITMRCDVMFLWKEVNKQSLLRNIPAKPGIDNIKYVDGALLWSVARSDVTKSGLSKLIGTDLYKKMTIRNCNTVRKLAEIVA